VVIIRRKAPASLIGGKANGNGVEAIEEDDEAEVLEDRQGVTPEAVEEMDVDVVTRLTLIHWLATAVGCVAIWPVTVPKRCRHRGVSIWDLPK